MGSNLRTISFTSGHTHRADLWEYLLPQAFRARKGFRTIEKKARGPYLYPDELTNQQRASYIQITAK